MSVNNDEPSSSSFETKRSFLIGGLLLLITGGFYWYHHTSPTASSPEVSSAQADLQAIAAQTGLPIEEKAISASALSSKKEQRPPVDADVVTSSPENKLTATKRTSSRSKRKVVSVAEREGEAIMTMPAANPAPSASVDRAEAAPVAPPAVVSTAPTTKATATSNPTLVRAETKKQSVPTELKPTVQPAPAPIVNPPTIKRKTKNDEDVQVDLN